VPGGFIDELIHFNTGKGYIWSIIRFLDLLVSALIVLLDGFHPLANRLKRQEI
jgi:hypothetical protein